MRKSKHEIRQPKEIIEKEVKTDIEGLFRILLGKDMNPTQRRFILDAKDEAFSRDIRGLGGAAGTGKSWAMMAKMLAVSMLVPGFKTGFGRYDYNKLVTWTIPDLETMLSRLPPRTLLDRNKTPPMTWWITTGGEPSTITFLNLKEYLGSSSFNHFYIEEASEIDSEATIDAIWSRLRAPDPYGQGFMLAMAFNPPLQTHWLYPACTGKDYRGRSYHDPRTGKPRPAWVKWYRPEARENAKNLRANYYEEMESMGSDERTSKLEGNFGAFVDGLPVYKQFNYDLHTVEDIPYQRWLPLIRMWDFGYNTPVCIWCQADEEGYLNVLREEIGDKITIASFVENRVYPLTRKYFPDATRFLDVGDPAARQEKDTGSTMAELMRLGVYLKYDVNVPIMTGVKLLRNRLEKLIEGRPAFRISRNGCPITIQALKGGYHMGKVLNASGEPQPVKDGVFDHPADALRYGTWYIYAPGKYWHPDMVTADSYNLVTSLEYKDD